MSAHHRSETYDHRGPHAPPDWAVRQAIEELPDGADASAVEVLAWQLAHAAAERYHERHDSYDDPDEGGEA